MLEVRAVNVPVRLQPEQVNKYYLWREVAMALAARVLGRRSWSTQDREDAAAEGMAENLRLILDPEVSREDVRRALEETIGAFRKREGAVRRSLYHPGMDLLDGLLAARQTQSPLDQLLVRRDLERKERLMCKKLLSDDATPKAVGPVVLLAALTQIQPVLVDERLVRLALEASGGRNGIRRSPASFRELFPSLLNDLALAMEAKPRCKQFPDEIRKLAWLFRGEDGERFEELSRARLDRYVAWFYKQRSRGEERLGRAAGGG